MTLILQIEHLEDGGVQLYHMNDIPEEDPEFNFENIEFEVSMKYPSREIN